MKTAILVPCYNEAATVGKVVRDFLALDPDVTVYVYDNNSTDGTARIAAEAGAVVVREYRQGKGRVVRSMFRDVDADIYVMVDGDDTYPADEALAIAAANPGRQPAGLATLTCRPASLPFISGYDGRLHRGADLDRSHWQACPERCDGWTAALAVLAGREVDVCLQIGPGFLDDPSSPQVGQSGRLGLLVSTFQTSEVSKTSQVFEGDMLSAQRSSAPNASRRS